MWKNFSYKCKNAFYSTIIIRSVFHIYPTWRNKKENRKTLKSLRILFPSCPISPSWHNNFFFAYHSPHFKTYFALRTENDTKTHPNTFKINIIMYTFTLLLCLCLSWNKCENNIAFTSGIIIIAHMQHSQTRHDTHANITRGKNNLKSEKQCKMNLGIQQQKVVKNYNKRQEKKTGTTRFCMERWKWEKYQKFYFL